MQLMLSKNQTQRFCKLEQIQSHIWFKEFSWDDLISLNMKPAFIPNIENNEDKCETKPYLDYIKGRELFDVIRDIGLLNKFQTQFYGASIMLAVQYLHERKFIYRDIKPENIMVLGNGYIKLIDFGTAKAITDRTKTIIGTPHYMAPEVILGEGYTFKVDFWSIGICMYEFMCGGVPFGENHEEPMDVYLAVINE